LTSPFQISWALARRPSNRGGVGAQASKTVLVYAAWNKNQKKERENVVDELE
jgi:hypothetical protein